MPKKIQGIVTRQIAPHYPKERIPVNLAPDHELGGYVWLLDGERTLARGLTTEAAVCDARKFWGSVSGRGKLRLHHS